jgi:hypothetical protein
MRLLIFPLMLVLCSACLADETLISPELTQGLELFNNAQLIEAYSYFQTYVQKEPDDPAANFLLALSKWRIMWLSTYNEFDKEELIGQLDKVNELCEAQTEPKIDCAFFNASVTGIRAQITATENQWWETAQLGKKMKHQSEDILDVDAEYYPALYLLGSYNYFADALPGYLKFIRSLVFLPGGDRTQGLKQLITAYQKGGVVSGEAGRTLAIIYTYFQKRPEYGVKMCDNLLTTYPLSYDVSLYRGINLYFDKSWEESLAQLELVHKQVLAYSQKHSSVKNPETTTDVVYVFRPLEREARYWMSRNLIQLERYDEAQEILLRLANPPVHQPYWLIRWVYLSLAQIEYEKKNPEAGDAWIDKVLAWKDVKDSTDKARLLRKKREKADTFDIDIR